MRSTTTSTVTLASVHLCDFPKTGEIDPRDEGLEQAMALAREVVRLGLGARGQGKVKLRQPLARGGGRRRRREREAIERLKDIVRDELNVQARALRDRRRGAGQLRGQGELPQVGAVVRPAICPPRRRSPRSTPRGGGLAARGGGTVGIAVAAANELVAGRRAPHDGPEGYGLEREGAHAVALELNARRAHAPGGARANRPRGAAARRSAGLVIEDRIELALGGDRPDRGRRGTPRLHGGRDARRRALLTSGAPGPAEEEPMQLLRAGRDDGLP